MLFGVLGFVGGHYLVALSGSSRPSRWNRDGREGEKKNERCAIFPSLQSQNTQIKRWTRDKDCLGKTQGERARE